MRDTLYCPSCSKNWNLNHHAPNTDPADFTCPDCGGATE